MKNQITPEIKAHVQCLYMGCELFVPDEPKETWYPFNKHEACLKLVGISGTKAIVERIAEQKYDLHNQTQLIVTPLSAITDEDATEVSKIIDPDPNGFGYNFYKWTIEKYTSIACVSDYLRLKRYAVPAFGFSVDELVEGGVFKSREVTV